MSKRKQIASASQERGGTEENKHVKKPRLSGKSEEQAPSSSSSSSSSSSADVFSVPSTDAQLAQAQVEIERMKREHAAEQKRNAQLMSYNTELTRSNEELTRRNEELTHRNEELKRENATLRRCFLI